ncbi:MAG: CPBP family intramembrane metalloprotease [Clostridia bacterium]|nr:CPBP family intramembrane metalloprotease [Clostridia bacterium]
MNKYTKRVNVLFLSIILLYLGIVVLFSILKSSGHTVTMLPSLLISEAIILVPGICMIAAAKMPLKEYIPHRRIKISTALLLIVLSYALMPVASFINILSQFLTENVLASSATDIMSQPFIVMLFIMGIYGPLCEEFIFRGIIYSGYTKSGRVWGAILMSSLLFGLMHMNLNQFGYAFFLGIAFAIVIKITDSLLATVIMHCVINLHNVSMMYGSQYMLKAAGMKQDMEKYSQGIKALGDGIYGVVIVLFIVSIFAIAISGLLLYAITRNENRLDVWNRLFHKNMQVEAEGIQKQGMLTVPLCIAIIICVSWIIYGLM